MPLPMVHMAIAVQLGARLEKSPRTTSPMKSCISSFVTPPDMSNSTS